MSRVFERTVVAFEYQPQIVLNVVRTLRQHRGLAVPFHLAEVAELALGVVVFQHERFRQVLAVARNAFLRLFVFDEQQVSLTLAVAFLQAVCFGFDDVVRQVRTRQRVLTVTRLDSHVVNVVQCRLECVCLELKRFRLLTDVRVAFDDLPQPAWHLGISHRLDQVSAAPVMHFEPASR